MTEYRVSGSGVKMSRTHKETGVAYSLGGGVPVLMHTYFSDSDRIEKLVDGVWVQVDLENPEQ